MSSSQGGEQGPSYAHHECRNQLLPELPAHATPCQFPGPITSSCLAKAELATVSDIPVSVRD